MTPSTSKLAALIADGLNDVAGAKEPWLEIIGPVHKLSNVDHVRSTWEVIPGGTGRQRAAIAKAVRVVRADYPYVR